MRPTNTLPRRLRFADSPKNVGSMMAGRLAKHPRAMDDAASLGIICPKTEGFNARQLNERAGRLLEVVRAAARADAEIEAIWRGINDERLSRARKTASTR